MYVLKSRVGGCPLGIQVYEDLNSFGTVLGADAEGHTMRCMQYITYSNSAVFTGRPRSKDMVGGGQVAVCV